MFDAIFEWLKEFFQPFFLWLADVFWWIITSILMVLAWVLTALLTYLIQGFGFVFLKVSDGLFVFIHSFFATLDVSALVFNSTIGGELNEQLLWLIDQTGMVQCVSLLATAIGLRALLNLIPATITRI